MLSAIAHATMTAMAAGGGGLPAGEPFGFQTPIPAVTDTPSLALAQWIIWLPAISAVLCGLYATWERIACAACRGRHRAHDKSSRCRLKRCKGHSKAEVEKQAAEVRAQSEMAVASAMSGEVEALESARCGSGTGRRLE